MATEVQPQTTSSAGLSDSTMPAPSLEGAGSDRMTASHNSRNALESVWNRDRRRLLRSSLLIFTCTMAMITNMASSSAVSILVPIIGHDMRVSEGSLQWIVSAFNLSCGCLLIPFGNLSDIYGPKKMFIIGTAWTGAFSIGCAFSRNIVTLNILRGLRGLGSAAFLPACVGILARTFPPSKMRSVAFATFSAGAPIGGASGTQLGAVLSQDSTLTWKAPFFFFAAIAAVSLVSGVASINADTQVSEENRSIHWLGGVLVKMALAFVTFALGQGSVAPQRWKTPYILVLLVLGLSLILVFQAWEHRLEQGIPGYSHPPPLLKPSIWFRPRGRFAAMQAIAFFKFSAFISWYFYCQLYYEDDRGLSPVGTAIRLLPMTVSGILCNLLVIVVISRLDAVFLIGSGTTFTGVGALLFAVIIPSASYWAFGFPATVVSVLGADFVFAAGSLYVAKVVEPEEQSVAGGLFQSLTQLGSAFGLAVTTIAHNSVAESSQPMDGRLPLRVYQAAQWASFSMAMFGTLLAVLFLRGVGPIGQPGEPLVTKKYVEQTRTA